MGTGQWDSRNLSSGPGTRRARPVTKSVDLKDALQILQTWDGLQHLDSRIAPPWKAENLFAFLRPRIRRDEGIHSDYLAWLLDPQAWHGLGDRFIEPFVAHVMSRVGRGDTTRIDVHRIEKEAGTGNGPIDILLTVRVD